MNSVDCVKRPDILVYVFGPYSSPTLEGVSANIAFAQAVGTQVAALGFTPVIPHSMTIGIADSQDNDFWYRGTLEIMLRCDALVGAPGWTLSHGSWNEAMCAFKMGIPVYHAIESLVENAACLVAAVDRKHGSSNHTTEETKCDLGHPGDSDLEELETFMEKGAEAWSDVPDAAEWVRKMRGE